MNPGADFLGFVEGAHAELQTPSLGFRYLSFGANYVTGRSRGNMLRLNTGAHRRLAEIVVLLDGVDGCHLHDTHHRRRGHHARQRGIEFAREVLLGDGDGVVPLASNRDRTHQSPPTITKPTKRWIINASDTSAPTVYAIVRPGCAARR